MPRPHVGCKQWTSTCRRAHFQRAKEHPPSVCWEPQSWASPMAWLQGAWPQTPATRPVYISAACADCPGSLLTLNSSSFHESALFVFTCLCCLFPVGKVSSVRLALEGGCHSASYLSLGAQTSHCFDLFACLSSRQQPWKCDARNGHRNAEYQDWDALFPTP